MLLQQKLSGLLKKFGNEINSATAKALATLVVGLFTALALSSSRKVGDYLLHKQVISGSGLITRAGASAAMGALLTAAIMARKNQKLQRELSKVSDEASRDSLTNIYNVSKIKPLLTERINAAQNKSQTFSMIMLDIDCFKRVNDDYSHDVGNFVLRQIADQLSAACRSSDDLVFRCGGDEFLIASQLRMPDEETYDPATPRVDEGYGFANRLRRDISNTELLVEENSHRRVKVTVSCGVTTYTEADTVQELMKRVSEALHLAKQPRIDSDGKERSKNFVYLFNTIRKG